MRQIIAPILVLSSLAAAQTPVCNAERASLLLDLGPTQRPRLVKCDGQRWVPWDVPAELCSAPLEKNVAVTPTAIAVVEKTPEQLAACKSSCTTQNASCLKNQCGPIAGAPCKQRCAKSLAICTTGCTPKPPEPARPVTAPSVPSATAPAAPAVTVTQPPPLPARNAPPAPSALETFGKALDVVDRGLDVIDGSNQPASAPSGSGSSSGSGLSASATCCLNGAGYSCPSAAAVDRCSGAFMRCMMSGKSGETCMKEAPPDPSGCRRDTSISCK